MVGCDHNLECLGGGGGWGFAPRAESSRHDGTTLAPSRGMAPLYPEEGMTVPPLYPELVCLRSCLFPMLKYLVQVQGWDCRTWSRCIIHYSPLTSSILHSYQMTWKGRQQFNCKFGADATPNRSSLAPPNPEGILLGHTHHMTAAKCCQHLLFHEIQ